MVTELGPGAEPFREALEHFERKRLVPTERWLDLLREGHDAGFTVAGVAKAELLQGIRDDVLKALEEGTSFQQFQKGFEGLLAKHGWSPKQGAAWRARIIFDTNLRTAHQAGRWRQMTAPAMLKARPFWVYRHGESIVPRPAHLAWNGQTLPANDPWFQTHYPPNGWGCRCRVFPITRGELGGREPDPAPPVEWQTWRDPKTGREIRHPKGIDPGWDYAPGASLAQRARQVARRKLPRLDPDLRKEVEGALPQPAAAEWRALPGTRKGSNPGGLYDAPDGTRHYVKFPATEAQARSEVAADALYRGLGIDTLEHRLIELPGPDGQPRLAVASPWREDLSPVRAADLVARPEAAARLYQGSVLTKNWDFLGLDLDNVMLDRTGNLVLVDAGGAFRHRAQGALKAFGADIAEVRSFLDPAVNPQAAGVYRELFRRDAWLERNGAEPLLRLDRSAIARALAEAGITGADARELESVLVARRQLLLDRYDLEGRLAPRGGAAGAHLAHFQTWGREMFEREVSPVNGAVFSRELQAAAPALVQRFKQYVEREVDRGGVEVLRGVFSEWSGNSSTTSGALGKRWAQNRFGVGVTYHGGLTGAAAERAATADAARWLRDNGISSARAYALLDAEYAFHQYHLRRLHGWDPFVLERGMDAAEYRGMFRGGRFRGNAVVSTTTDRNVFAGADHRLKFDGRAEEVVKTWYQGRAYMSFGRGEAEYIIVGRERAATDI